MSIAMKFLLAVLLSLALTWWSWRGRFTSPTARVAAAARALGLLALLLLFLDPGIAARGLSHRPIVLLDNSVSMHATGGRAAEAAALAASLGDTTTFGEVAPNQPAGITLLADGLRGALSSGRDVMVVTDGEVADRGTIAPELLAESSVRVLARPSGPDIALVGVRGPSRLALGDTLALEVELLRTTDARDTTTVHVLAGEKLLASVAVHFGASDRTSVRVDIAMSRSMQGAQWLEILRAGAPDLEPQDDRRWWLVEITPAPGIVVMATSPDWDSRALYRTLKDVANAPVRGYLQFEPGQWRRMDDLRKVPAVDVMAAARAADLLAVRGDPEPWRTTGRARLLWPPSDQPGDWYVTPSGLSPVAGAFAGIDPDSLPPAAAVHRVDVDSIHGWIGAVAKQGRRGGTVAVIGGREGPAGRTVLIGADGLYRWAFPGGASDQAWRSMIAAATSWLLASPATDGTLARPVELVTQRGRPVRFRWAGAGAAVPVPIELRDSQLVHTDTLRFDGRGEATIVLSPGRYHYTLTGGGAGSLGVEPYSDELVPTAVTLKEHTTAIAPKAPRRSLRELLLLFTIALLGLGAEWMLRRRLGLR